MAKQKKRRRKQRNVRRRKRPSVKLLNAVNNALQLYEDGDDDTAKQELIALADRNPRNQAVLLALLEVARETESWAIYAFYGERLWPMEYGDDQVETLNNLAYAHMQLGYPALLYYYAQEVVTRHPHYEHIGQLASMVDDIRPLLLGEIADSVGIGDVDDEQKLSIVVGHDRIRFYAERGYYEEAIPAAVSFLKEHPTIIPVYNNLSLAYFAAGNTEKAIAVSQQVLLHDADNCHALGNLVHFTFVAGEIDQAREYAVRLHATPIIDENDLNIDVKRAESFAFLGEDQWIWDVYERAQEVEDVTIPLLLHLAAVAAYRLGNAKEAERLWRKALKHDPAFVMARICLSERHHLAGEQDISWYWPLRYWISPDVVGVMGEYAGDGETVAEGMNDLLVKRPFLPTLFPHMLERGDTEARDFVLDIIENVETPEMLQMLHTFALSPHGTDKTRLRAIQFLAQYHPERLPENKQALMWVKGKQTEIAVTGITITNESKTFEGIPDETVDKFDEATELLKAGKLEKAELLLLELINDYPDFPPPYNQLAMVYERKGGLEAAEKLVREIYARFPDYFFGKTAYASILIRDGEIEEAREILRPLSSISTLHFSEFNALMRMQVHLALEDEDLEEARSWLEMWRSVDPDHSEIKKWEKVINGRSSVQQKLGSMLKRLQGKKI